MPHKILRSVIHERLPFDLRFEVELLSKQRDISNGEKQGELIKLLRNYDIPIVALGPGTNRYAFKLDGFVIKVATDQEGKIDNLKEFKVSRILTPKNCSKTYEVSQNGTFIVAEYAQIFSGFDDMMRYESQIKEKLSKIHHQGYLIGDVGLSPKNFANWGIRVGTKEVIMIDYAYFYNVSSNKLVCDNCKAGSILVPTSNFVELTCPTCHKTTTFQNIQRRISQSERFADIGDLSDIGYVLENSNVDTELDTERSMYLIGKKNKNNTPIVPEIVEESQRDIFISKSYNEEDSDMSWKDTARTVDPTTGNIRVIVGRPLSEIIAEAKAPKVDNKTTAGQHSPTAPIEGIPTVANVTEQKVVKEVEEKTKKATFHFEEIDKKVDSSNEPEDDDNVEEMEAEFFPDDSDDDKSYGGYENVDCYDGLVELTTDNEKVRFDCGFSQFPFYGQFINRTNYREYRDTHVPSLFFFLKHFKPTLIFETETPEVYANLGKLTSMSEELSIIPISIYGKKYRFAVYVIGAVTDDADKLEDIDLSTSEIADYYMYNIGAYFTKIFNDNNDFCSMSYYSQNIAENNPNLCDEKDAAEFIKELGFELCPINLRSRDLIDRKYLRHFHHDTDDTTPEEKPQNDTIIPDTTAKEDESDDLTDVAKSILDGSSIGLSNDEYSINPISIITPKNSNNIILKPVEFDS